MSMHGNSSGYDLIKRMQLRGDFQTAQIMFDHVKHVEGWTTHTCHVYDSFYYQIMTIIICDMQSKDTEVQCVMWQNLNKMWCSQSKPKDSWPTTLKPIGMLFELSMVMEMQVSRWLTKKNLFFSIESIHEHTHKTTYQARVAKKTQDIVL